MKTSSDRPDIPLGLGMALAQNGDMLHWFATQTPERQRQIIDRTHTIQSRDEMRAFVANLDNMA